MKVKELLSDPSKWCKGSYARTIEGERAYSSFSPDAVSWCILGAIDRCYVDRNNWKEIVDRLFAETGESPATWNDRPTTTFADVRKLVEKLDV